LAGFEVITEDYKYLTDEVRLSAYQRPIKPDVIFDLIVLILGRLERKCHETAERTEFMVAEVPGAENRDKRKQSVIRFCSESSPD
jgi:hypothetical protein